MSEMNKSGQRIVGNPLGFTLVEILIAIAVFGLLSAVAVGIFSHMQHSSTQQIAMNMLQQNQRGALDILEHDLRLIGMDWNQTGNFKITDVKKYSIVAPAFNAVPDGTPSGSPALRMQLDLDDDGVVGAKETITYSLFDRDGDGQPPWELSRSESMLTGSNSIDSFQMIAEGVEAIGFAYAFDADDDGDIDRAPPAVPGGSPSIIWAVDSDNNGTLDADVSGAAIGKNVPPDKIRGVQFWILGRTLRPDPKHLDNRQYSVGDQVLQPGGPQGDHFRRWLLTEIIHCRNL